jgi:hypothetical protein
LAADCKAWIDRKSCPCSGARLIQRPKQRQFDLLMSIESYLTYIRRLVKLGELDSLLQAIA